MGGHGASPDPSSNGPGREEDVVSGAAKRKMWRGLTNWPLGGGGSIGYIRNFISDLYFYQGVAFEL